MLASGGKILALGKVYHDLSLKGTGRPGEGINDPLRVSPEWVLDLVNDNVSGATQEWVRKNFQPSGDYVSADDFNKYKNEVSSAFSATSAWANDTFVTNNTFNTYSADIHTQLEQKFYTSAFSASFSSAFNQEFNTYIASATEGWDHTEYSAGPGIKIEDHIVSLEPSAVPFDNYYTKDQTSGADQLSAAFNKYKEWSETSAWAEQTFIPQTASANWDLDKYSGHEGIEVKDHWIGLSADYVTPQNLEDALTSAVPSVISTDDTVKIKKYTSAGHPEYDLHVDLTPRITISGERGISAQDLGDGNWLIGASADNLAYLNTSFEKKELVDPAVPSGSIIQFTGGERKDITVTDGIITIPDSVDKFTICMNATIDSNIPIPDPHTYMLNQFVLSAVGENDALIRTHDYYPSEVGAADSNIAATIKHSKGRQYCIVYEGSDVNTSANMNVQLTILEEVMSISDGSGGGIEYTGTLPIYVNNQQRKINLEYDADFFTLNDQNELTLAQQSGSGSQPVDPVLFNKLLQSVNQRIVETIPIGMVSSTKDQSIDNSKSYLFRPMIEFDMLSTTTARILTSNCSAGTSSVMVAVYEVDENTAKLTPMWWSVNTVLQKQSGQHVLHCHPDCTQTRTLKPEKLYYVEVIVHGQTTHFLGIDNAFRTDIGDFDITYGRQNVTSAYTNWNPSHFNNQPASVLGDTALGDFKPYVGFRNDPV